MKYLIAALAISGLALGACNKKQETKAAPPAASQAEIKTAKPEFAAPESFQVGLGKVYAGYLQIEGSLANDDFQKVKESFQSMHAVLHMISTEGVDSLAGANWDSLDVRFMRVLHPMAASENIGVMRDHLADFTPLMLDAIEKFGIKESDPVFRFHCPMARNSQGADWLQRDKSLMNPFYGKAMLQCGNLVEEVKVSGT